MNWKKFWLFTAVASATPPLEAYLHSVTIGQPMPFTFGTIGIPIVTTLATTLLALFTHPPDKDAHAAGETDKTLAGPPMKPIK